MQQALALALICAASAALSEVVRRVALHQQVLDVPNSRSSHRVPTPRGGGIAIAVTTIAGTLLLGRFAGIPAWLMLGVCMPGAAISMVGLIDDITGLSARVRLAAHVLACAAGLACLPLESLPGMAGNYLAGIGMAGFYMVGLVWSVNLYNFMDGIDGLAASEAVFIGSSLTILAALAGSPAVALPATVSAVSALGFLTRNWPPARLFMGDSGSVFLGYVLAFCGLAVTASGVSAWAVAIVAGAFVVDATLTLLVRLLRGEKVHDAHKTHAYQRLAVRWGGHRPVTLLYAAINLMWLGPMALAAQAGMAGGLLLAAIAYLPLIAGALLAGTGRPLASTPH